MAQNMEEPQGDVRVGVYVCHCGGNISDVVDVKAVAAAIGADPRVVVSREYPFMCSDPGQALIIEDIKAKGINRVVVAACSPTLHELTFRKTLERAGINPYLFEHVNIREQVSWVHKGDHDAATRKAVRLALAGVEKVTRQTPLSPIEVNVQSHVVVIGGGVAGLRAALSVARQGLGATVVEKADTLGGRMLELDTVYPTEERAADLLAGLIEEVRREERIEVLTGAEVEGIEGHVGKFRVAIRAGQPDDPAAQRREVPAGAIIVATGFDHYRPATGEFGYGESPAVVTLPEFLGILSSQPAGARALTHNGREVKRLAFIHCVGSRQTEGVDQPQADGKVNDYCSRTCCTATLHAIKRVQDRYPGTRIYDLNKDIRTYGRGHEAYYEEAGRRGALFFRYPDEEPPHVETAQAPAKGKAGGNGTAAATLTFRDRLTWGEELSAEADMVVLATGMVPRDISDIIGMKKLPVGADRFLQEVHPKLRPVEMGVAGVLLAGTCQGPMDIGEACAAGETAGAKAAILLSRPVIELDPFVAVVDPERCDGCELCLAECSYKGALEVVERPGGGKSARLAVVTPALCVGCGACAAVCPPRAINVAGWTLDQFDAMVDAIVADDAPRPAEAPAGVPEAAPAEAEAKTAPAGAKAASGLQEMLKAARARKGPVTPEQQERGKQQRQVQKLILDAVATEAKSVPDIAAETGLPEQDVLWWITALRKYDRVQEEAKRRGPSSYRKK